MSLGDAIRSNAAISTRPGQLAQLERIADEVDDLAARLELALQQAAAIARARDVYAARLERAEAVIAAVRELALMGGQDPADMRRAIIRALAAAPTAGQPGDGGRTIPNPPKPAQPDPARWLAPPGPGDFECCASGSCEVCRR